METVLGLSLTSTSVDWILVDRNDTDGTALDHDSFDIADAATGADASRQLAAVRGAQAIAASSGHQVRSIGVTWTDDVDTTAVSLLKALPEWGFDNVVAVRSVVSSGDTQLALARAAALAVATNAESDTDQPVRRKPRFAHVGAVTAVVAGAIAIFAIGPEFDGPQGATETRPAAESSSATSPISVSSATPAGARYMPPIAAPSAQQASPLVADPPQVSDEPERVDTTVATAAAASPEVATPSTETPTAVPVAATQDHIAAAPVAVPQEHIALAPVAAPQAPVAPVVAPPPTPFAPPPPVAPPPTPAPAPQDPVAAVLSPLFGALP